jgi:hypothetical protein
MKARLTLALAGFGILALSPLASASVLGQLDLSSGANTVTVTADSVTWNGPFTVTSNTTLTYDGGTPVTTGTQGQLANLPPASQPNFVTFPSIPSLSFSLLTVDPGSSNLDCATLALFESCSVEAGSHIVLTLTPTGTTVSLSASGTATDGTLPISDWEGVFSQPIVGFTPAEIQAAIGKLGSVTQPYSANFVVTLESTVPEPSTASMLAFASGCLGFALVRRQRSLRAH